MKFTFLFVFLLFGINIYATDFKTSKPKDIALAPIQNNVRNVLDLSGMWKFKKDSANIGEQQAYYNGLTNCRTISVPGSWNAQFDDMRDYLDWVWYETDTYIPSSWKDQNIFIRVNDATYSAKIWINGKPVGYHEGCHVPFAFDIANVIKWDQSNKIVIKVENQLSPSRVPTGNVKGGSLASNPAANYDFFPYSGLNRSVVLYSLPKTYIQDITVKPNYEGTTGLLDVIVETKGKATKATVTISGQGKEITVPVKIQNNKGIAKVKIPNVRLWCPEDPYLYMLSVSLGEKSNPKDIYSLKTGVRTVSTNAKQILLNGKPVYLKGFGRHEDFPVLGRSSSNSLIVKDFELMKWTGANSFRTAHYPYDEENYNLADREGFMIIGETPGVGLYFSGDSAELKARQTIMKQYIEEMYLRDKNHPSVIMWCVANEPNDKVALGQMSASSKEDKAKAEAEFEKLFTQIRSLDDTRLIMYVGVMMGPINWFKLTDVIAINRYWGWYTSPGSIEQGANTLSKELDRLYRKFKKPCMVTEFGADTYAGFNAVTPEMFTEEYQKEFIKAYLDVADSKDFVTGMHVWNFADFKTSQSMIRFGGYNLKGVFTRDRRPKMAAHYLRSVWKGQ
ncbi:beta-glucuronidase [Plebeiibacterium marinum]|uniref:Beta-glucuronidase n=1 Tax=Plebeiibacterium marinum TaxID=2992111 RepID=A0AAE3MFU3_9BACT|nr:beta-glucuronidase [Plebeiobacterium marinum]MCW3807049.1 beta-glucuronidase [Plebeiobacterium marinum]